MLHSDHQIDLGDGSGIVGADSNAGSYQDGITETFTDLQSFLHNEGLTLDIDYKITTIEDGRTILWLKNAKGALVEAGVFHPWSLKPESFGSFYDKCEEVVDTDLIMIGFSQAGFTRRV